jgi:uroporphyrinogen decarboxylase
MNDRERFIATVLGEPVDRPPYWLFWSPWERTWRRWEKEGKPAHIIDLRKAFGSDQPPMSLPVNCGPCPKIEPTILEQDEDYYIHVDSWGITRRDYKHGESMAEFLDFPVKTREDWEKYNNTYLNPAHPERLSGNWRELGKEWMDNGVPIQLGYYPDVGVFGTVRWLLGDEQGLMAFYTMPDVVHDIMDHMTTLYLTVFEKVVQEISVDVIHIWEDMCYRNGPLISPRHWESFMGPNYRRIKSFADKHNIPVISVDTDGNPDKITKPMMHSGVNYLFPMEVAAGCDVNEWRNKYPALAMMGGIDKRALAHGRDAIDRELQRITPALQAGRYIPALDHLIPDDVSWSNYCYYAQSLRNLIGKQ